MSDKLNEKLLGQQADEIERLNAELQHLRDKIETLDLTDERLRQRWDVTFQKERELHELQHRLWGTSESNEYFDLMFEMVASERDGYRVALQRIAQGADGAKQIAQTALREIETHQRQTHVDYLRVLRHHARHALQSYLSAKRLHDKERKECDFDEEEV